MDSSPEQKELEKLKRPGGLFSSHLDVSGPSVDENDWAEVWGRRIGGSLAAIVFIWIVGYFFFVFLAGM